MGKKIVHNFAVILRQASFLLVEQDQKSPALPSKNSPSLPIIIMGDKIMHYQIEALPVKMCILLDSKH